MMPEYVILPVEPDNLMLINAATFSGIQSVKKIRAVHASLIKAAPDHGLELIPREELAQLRADALLLSEAILGMSMTMGDRFSNEGQAVVDSYETAWKYRRANEQAISLPERSA